MKILLFVSNRTRRGLDCETGTQAACWTAQGQFIIFEVMILSMSAK
jgi:hypothetical protein